MPINKAIKRIRVKSKHEPVLKKLQLKKKKVLEQLVQHKNKLTEFKESLKIIAYGPQKQIFESFENIFKKSTLEILEVLEKVLKVKSLKKRQREMVLEMKETLEDNLKEAEKSAREEIDFFNKIMTEKMEEAKAQLPTEDLDNYKPRNFEQAWKEFTSETEIEEKKDMRSLYLEIVKQFHPDKFVGSPDEEKYHLLLQKANQAYQMNDFEALISLREDFLGDSNSLSGLEGAENIDELEALQARQIAILEKELTVLESQLIRLKEEIKKLNKSELGTAHKSFQKINKESAADFEVFNREMDIMKNAFIDFLGGGDFPEELFEELEEEEISEGRFVRIPDDISEEELMAALAQMMNLARKSQERSKTSKTKTKKVKKK